MLDLNNDARSTGNSNKSQKIQSNLKLIKSLLKNALQELKESERISTNESENSEIYSPDKTQKLSIDLNK